MRMKGEAMKKHDIPKDVLERIEDELLVGERLLWAGLPGKRFAMDMAMKATLVGLLGMFMLGVLAFIVTSQTTGDIWLSSTTLPIIMIVVGLAVFMIRQQQAPQADLYVITNRRSMILRKKSVQSFSAEDLRFIERRMHKNGTGDIIFNREYYQRMTMAMTTPLRTRESKAIGFFGVENPVEVEALMLETFRSDADTKHKLDDDSIHETYDYYEDKLQEADYSE